MSASPPASSLDELLSNGGIECADGLLEPYINDLFNLPTKNIKSAFGLILGLIKAQSAEISELKAAQLDYTRRENEVRIRLESEQRTAVSKWESECNEITEKLRLLKKDQNDAFKTQEKANALVGELKDELKVRRRIKSLSVNFFFDLCHVAQHDLDTQKDSCYKFSRTS